MKKYKRNYWKELWWNRPWVYIPEVIRSMKSHPFRRGDHGNFCLWLRNMFYLNWQVCFVRVEEDG